MPAKPIQDEFTHLIPTLGSARVYALRHQVKGLCILCNEPAVMGVRCFKHQQMNNQASKKRYSKRLSPTTSGGETDALTAL